MLSSATRRGGLQACIRHRQLSTSTEPRLVLSRRAWQAHAKKLPAKPKPKATKEDKPWPREYQIAGYAAAGLFIPYSLLWFALSNPSARAQLEAIAPDLVDNPRLRKHFGELEWDAQAYGDKDSGELGPEYYHYTGEVGWRERYNEALVQERNSKPVEANLYLLRYGGTTSSVETKQVPSSIPANPESLKQAFGVSNESNSLVALDFPKDDELTEDSNDGTLSDQLTEFVEPDPTLKLRQERHTFSSWHHFPLSSAEEQKALSQNQRMSDLDVEIARLEYTLAELEKDLKDPNCTKDIDTMNEDRSKAKSELRRLKWKRRLGVK